MRRRVASSPRSSFCNNSHRQIALGHPLHFGQELFGQDGNVGLLQAGRGEDVHHTLRGHSAGDDLAHRQVEVLFGTRFSLRPLGKGGSHLLEEPDVVTYPERLFVGNGQSKGLGKFAYRLQAAVLPIFLGKNVLLGGRQQQPTFLGWTCRPFRPVEAVEQGAADIVPFQHHRHRFFLVDGGVAGPAALGVGE